MHFSRKRPGKPDPEFHHRGHRPKATGLLLKLPLLRQLRAALRDRPLYSQAVAENLILRPLQVRWAYHALTYSRPRGP